MISQDVYESNNTMKVVTITYIQGEPVAGSAYNEVKYITVSRVKYRSTRIAIFT